MPFTPFHLGPAMLLGFKYERKLDLMSLALASVVLDIEPFLSIVTGKGAVHGFFHSFLGASIAGMITFVILCTPCFCRIVDRLRTFFRIEQKTSLKMVTSAVFFCIYLHVFLDSFLYPEIKPLYPSTYNPLYNHAFLVVSYIIVYSLCSVTLIMSCLIYKHKLGNIR